VQDANIKLAGYMNDLYNEQLNNVQQMQSAGTLFSGIRPQLLAQAQNPTWQNIGQLQLDTGRSLNDIYNQAQGLLTAYNAQNMSNISAAAQRNLDAINQAKMLAALTPKPDTTTVPGTVNPGGNNSNLPSYDETTWPSDSQTANIDYAQSPAGQQAVSQVQAHPASAGSSGAAQVLLAASQGRNTPNYQARRNAF
jgi:hypothetical protein